MFYSIAIKNTFTKIDHSDKNKEKSKIGLNISIFAHVLVDESMILKKHALKNR
jgi:hypothetical protein